MVNKPTLPKFKVISGTQTRRKRVFNDPVMNADEILIAINGILKKSPDRIIAIKTKDESGELSSVNPLYRFGDLVIGPNDGESFSIPCVVLEVNSLPLTALPTIELRKVLSEMSKTTREFCYIFITFRESNCMYGIRSIEFKKTSGLIDVIIFNKTRQAFELGAGMDKWWEIASEGESK